MIRFEINDIDDNEWLALNYFLESVENGIFPENNLLDYEVFLHMLAAIKFDANNYIKIPQCVRVSSLTEKYCKMVNPDVVKMCSQELTDKVKIYKNYLGL